MGYMKRNLSLLNKYWGEKRVSYRASNWSEIPRGMLSYTIMLLLKDRAAEHQMHPTDGTHSNKSELSQPETNPVSEADTTPTIGG